MYAEYPLGSQMASQVRNAKLKTNTADGWKSETVQEDKQNIHAKVDAY